MDHVIVVAAQVLAAVAAKLGGWFTAPFFMFL